VLKHVLVHCFLFLASWWAHIQVLALACAWKGVEVCILHAHACWALTPLRCTHNHASTCCHNALTPPPPLSHPKHTHQYAGCVACEPR
jgi:hypothetical protein